MILQDNTILELSSVDSFATANTLQRLIEENSTHFTNIQAKQLFTPKMHFLMHLPYLLQLGLLRQLWYVRFKAKIGFFKTHWWFNFKNIVESQATLLSCCASCGYNL